MNLNIPDCASPGGLPGAVPYYREYFLKSEHEAGKKCPSIQHHSVK